MKNTVKKIYRSERDIYSLSQKTSSLKTNKRTSYKKVVVNKPWGYEYLMYENDKVAVWVLYLKKGYNTSMHCHPKKKTSLIALSGQVLVSFLNEKCELNNLDAVMIDRGVFHSSETISSDGAMIMEIETPPEKADLVRLTDKYGRENNGYENSAFISNELHKYEYEDFHEIMEEDKAVHKQIKNRHIQIQRNEKIDDLVFYVKQCSRSIICFLDSILKKGDSSVIFEIGDIITQSELEDLDVDQLKINNSFNTLIIH